MDRGRLTVIMFQWERMILIVEQRICGITHNVSVVLLANPKVLQPATESGLHYRCEFVSALHH